MVAMTHRWTIAPTGLDPDTEILQVSCSFVVGRHNVAALEEFALWCVREQIAIATAKLTNDIAEDIGGLPVHIPGHEGGDYRHDPDDWHEVIYHYDRVVTPYRDLPANPVLKSMGRAFELVQQGMFDAGPAEAWLRFKRLEDFRSYGGTALRLTATIPGLDLSAPPAQARQRRRRARLVADPPGWSQLRGDDSARRHDLRQRLHRRGDGDLGGPSYCHPRPESLLDRT